MLLYVSHSCLSLASLPSYLTNLDALGLMCCHGNASDSHPSCEGSGPDWGFFLKVVFLLPLLMPDSIYLSIYCKWICVWDLLDR